MTVSTGTILKVVATYLWLDGNVMQNVYATDIVGGAGPYALADVIDDCVDWIEDMYNNLTALITSEVDGSQVQVYEWDSVDGDWDELGSDPWNWNPTGATEALPYGVAALVNAKSVDADASGKKYIGGICENENQDGVFISTLITALLLYGADWITPFVGAASGATFSPGVWSVKDSALHLMSTSLVIPTVPAYQRRRKQGVGI